MVFLLTQLLLLTNKWMNMNWMDKPHGLWHNLAPFSNRVTITACCCCCCFIFIFEHSAKAVNFKKFSLCFCWNLWFYSHSQFNHDLSWSINFYGRYKMRSIDFIKVCSNVAIASSISSSTNTGFAYMPLQKRQIIECMHVAACTTKCIAVPSKYKLLTNIYIHRNQQ